MHEEKEAYIPPPDARYETQDVLTPKVAKGFFLILTIGVIMSILAMGALLKWFVHTAEPTRPTDPNVAAEGMSLPAGPRLQPAPGTDMQELAAKQKNRLEKYGNVDENHVHIPIERAMDLVLREGLPARQPVEAGGKQ
ncbi:MAG: hypothetical protein D6724_01265 [Armatimonadetes bacterium]|nr:MAG: hypothetical protein D6724_01265 [Armatimonadota bacterium]